MKSFSSVQEKLEGFFGLSAHRFLPMAGSCDSEKSYEMSAAEMIEEGEERPTVPVATQTGGRGEDRGNDSEQLLPGIHNDITVNHIIPRLLSVLLPVLSSVSGGWRRAMQSEQVYNARSRFHSTETLVAVNSNPHGAMNRIALYSTRDRTRYPLPPVPGFRSEFPASCKCISLDRKLYLIGGEGDLYVWPDRYVGPDNHDLDRGVEMYVLDMARSSLEWKECAAMERPRKDFGCGVKDGKIYVFGGYFAAAYDTPMFESEVYDPEEDCWCSILPMKTGRSGHTVATVGEELVVYGGCAYDFDGESIVHELEFYHPGRDEWRVVEPFGREGLCRMFLAQERFYAITLLGIFVHDDDIKENSWREIHSLSLPGLPACPLELSGHYYDFREATFDVKCPVLAVDGELLTVAYGHNSVTGEPEGCVMQSKGLGIKNKELEWEKAKCNKSLSFAVDQIGSPVLCPIIL